MGTDDTAWKFPTPVAHGREQGEIQNFRKGIIPGELEGRTLSRPPRPRENDTGLIRIRMRPSRALLVGLRSTPLDRVTIAPCCFAERKPVLSHALATLTALNKCAGQAVQHGNTAAPLSPVRSAGRRISPPWDSRRNRRPPDRRASRSPARCSCPRRRSRS